MVFKDIAQFRSRLIERPETFLQDLEKGVSYSRSQLLRASLALSRKLPAGTGSETTAVLLLKSAASYVIALLACWQKGLIPVVVDSAVTAERFEMFRSISRSGIVLSDFANAPGSPLVFDPAHLLIESEGLDLSGLSFVLSASAPWVIIFSSGTTGVPKCIPLSFDNLNSNIGVFRQRFDVKEGEAFLCASPLFYAHGLYNSILTTLFLGCDLYRSAPLNVLNVHRVFQALKDRPAVYFHMTPSMIPILEMAAKKSPDTRLRFKAVVSGTARLRREDREIFEATFETPIIEQYGLSETLFVAFQDNGIREEAFFGKPMGCELKILSESGDPLPGGQTGEIWIRSEASFGSYYNQPRETALAYHDGWFQSGDMGFLDAEGRLHIGARKKDIIKKGGVQISPLEIDQVLGSVAGVRECFTVGCEDRVYGEDVFSFIVGDPAEDELRAACGRQLPPTHMPRRFFFVKELPKTSSGKVMRESLRLMAAERLAA